MKKFIITILLVAFSVTLFAQASPPSPKKSFPIHSEKRMFIKKGDRHKHKRHHHHPKKNKIGGKDHIMDRHKK